MTINRNGDIITDPQELAALNAGKSAAVVNDMEARGGSTYIHSWAVEDASYLRLSNVTIGYNFPREMDTESRHPETPPVCDRQQPVCLEHPYTGFDPEVSTKGSNLTPGVDYGAYPTSHSYVFGLNVTF